jgi:hypothetical protein
MSAIFLTLPVFKASLGVVRFIGLLARSIGAFQARVIKSNAVAHVSNIML